MPLGISESLIQKAYAPVDLNGFYKGISEASVAAAKQKAEEKRAAQKEFSTTVATISKDVNGIKGEDSAEVNQHINAWKSATQRRNSISYSSNPEEWGKLNAESNSQYGLILAKAELSKTNKKEEQANLAAMRAHPDKFNDGAYGDYLKVIKMPTSKSSEIGENGLSRNDISQFQYTGPTVEQQIKFNEKLGKEGYSKGHIISLEGKGYVAGTDVEVPDLAKYGRIATDYVSVHGNKAAQLYINKNKDLIKDTQTKWDALPEDFFKGVKALDDKTGKYVDKYPVDAITGKRKPVLIFDETNPAATFISTISARGVMENPTKEGKQFTNFEGGKVGEKQAMVDISTKQTEGLLAIKDLYSRRKTLQAQDFTTGKLNTMKQLNLLESLGVKTAVGTAAKRIIDSLNAKDAVYSDEEVVNLIDQQLKIVKQVADKKPQKEVTLPGSPSSIGGLNTPKAGAAKESGKKPKPY